jgi:ABC-2 type transport system permease protein
MKGSRLAELARLGVSLRWRLVRNRAARLGKKTQRFAYILGGLYAAANLLGLATARYAADEAAERTVVLVVSSLALGWIFGPILMGGVDETVDPTRLALYPLRRHQLFAVQLSAALSGIGPMAASFGLVVGVPIAFADDFRDLPFAVVAAVVTVITIVGMARALAAGLAIAQRSRVGRDLAVLAAALVAGGLFVIGQLVTSFSGERAGQLVDGLQKAPWAWSTNAMVALRADDLGLASLWLAASLAAGVLSLAAWAQLSNFLLTNGERVLRTGRRNNKPVLNGARTVFGAALSRQWIYLRRSPNTRVALFFGMAFGVAFPILQIFQHGGDGSAVAAFGILLAMLANIGATSNVLGFDAGSLWIEVLCGGPGRKHMAARSLIVLPNLLLPMWFSGIVVGVWTGQWRAVAVVSLVALPVAFVVLAQGLVTSVLAPWPLPDGDNPFGNRQAAEGRGGRLATVALSGLGVAIVAVTPLLVAAWILLESPWVWTVPVIGIAWAAVLGGAVLRWVGNHLAGNEPELVERLSPIAVN